MAIKVLLAGVDTLHLHTKRPLRPEFAAEALKAKEQAKQTKPSSPLVCANFGRFRLPVRAYGTARGPVVAENRHLAVTLNPKAKDPFPSASVELRAEGLWSAGWENAGEAATRALEYCVGGRADVQVSRFDVCVDFQGWVPRSGDFERFVSRSRRRRPFFEPDTEEREEQWKGALALAMGLDGVEGAWALMADAIGEACSSSYFAGQRLTGFSFGSGDVVARLYDKTEEIKISNKGWFVPLWRKSGNFDPALPVWRLEFQLRRQAIQDLKPFEKFGEWETLRLVVPNLWKHLTREQLRHSARTKDDRQAVTHSWKELQAVENFEQVSQMSSDISRKRTVEAHAKCLAQAGGYLARLLAEEQFLAGEGAEKREPAAQVGSALELIRGHFDKKGTSLFDRAAELRNRMKDTDSVAEVFAAGYTRGSVVTEERTPEARAVQAIDRQRKAYDLRKTLELGDKAEVRWTNWNSYQRATESEAEEWRSQLKS